MTGTLLRRKRQRDAGEIDGFTLIEILIVIVVLGILAAVVIFALGGITGKTAQASCAADGATVSSAMAAFTAQNSAIVPTGGAASNMIVTSAGIVGDPYLQSWPNNTPHYGFQIVAGTLYVVTGSLYVSPGVYTLTGGDQGNLTPSEVAAATTTGNTQGAPALIPYLGSPVCSDVTTAVQ